MGTLLPVCDDEDDGLFSGMFEQQKPLKVVSTIFLVVCFVCLKESTCETRKNVFYFTSKALFILEIIKF